MGHYFLDAYTVCPGSSYPNLYNELLHKMGYYFLDIWFYNLSKRDQNMVLNLLRYDHCAQ